RRQHVFLRPITLGSIARRTRTEHSGASGGTASVSHGVPHPEPTPHAVPYWAWAAMIFLVALLLYVARWISER
ncbi:carbon monoxide dehydrogenase, partial [Mesorhizobium sp. M00.F.Ca.ET.186.01.1.1]